MRGCGAARRYGGAGAVWDIWPRDAAPTLRRYLAEHCAEFVHDGRLLEPGNVQDWISSQARSQEARITMSTHNLDVSLGSSLVLLHLAADQEAQSQQWTSRPASMLALLPSVHSVPERSASS